MQIARSRDLAIFFLLECLLCFPLLKLFLSFLGFEKRDNIRQQTAGNLHSDFIGNLWDMTLTVLISDQEFNCQ